jgi:hypothetical protein
MRPPAGFVVVFAATVVAVAACGGSASESPWPVEPEHREGAPVNESAAPGTPIDDRTPESRGEVSPNGPSRAKDAGAPAPSPAKRPGVALPGF